MRNSLSKLVGLCALSCSLSIVPAVHAQVTPRASSTAPAGSARWLVDPVHSQLEFRVRHLLQQVRGSLVD